MEPCRSRRARHDYAVSCEINRIIPLTRSDHLRIIQACRQWASRAASEALNESRTLERAKEREREQRHLPRNVSFSSFYCTIGHPYRVKYTASEAADHECVILTRREGSLFSAILPRSLMRGKHISRISRNFISFGCEYFRAVNTEQITREVFTR